MDTFLSTMLRFVQIHALVFFITMMVKVSSEPLQPKVVCYACSNSTDLKDCHSKIDICYGECFSFNVTLSENVVLYSKGCDTISRCNISGDCCSTDYCNGNLSSATGYSTTESWFTGAAVTFFVIITIGVCAGLYRRSGFRQTVIQRGCQILAPNQTVCKNDCYDPCFRFVPGPPPYEVEDKYPLPSYHEDMTLNVEGAATGTSCGDSSSVTLDVTVPLSAGSDLNSATAQTLNCDNNDSENVNAQTEDNHTSICLEIEIFNQESLY